MDESMNQKKLHNIKLIVTPEIKDSVRLAIDKVGKNTFHNEFRKPISKWTQSDVLLNGVSQDSVPMSKEALNELLDRYQACDWQFFKRLSDAMRRKPSFYQMGKIGNSLATILITGWIGGEVKSYLPKKYSKDIAYLNKYFISNGYPPLCFWTDSAIEEFCGQVLGKDLDTDKTTKENIKKTRQLLGLKQGLRIVKKLEVIDGKTVDLIIAKNWGK